MRVAAVLVLGITLFAEGLTQNSRGTASSLLHECEATFRDPGMQWMVMACLAVYLITFLKLNYSPVPRPLAGSTWTQRCLSEATLRRISFVVFISLAIISYALHYRRAAASLDTLTLIGAIVLGQAYAFWIKWERTNTRPTPLAFLAWMIIGLLLVATLWHPNAERFTYVGRARWAGPWSTPNTFGPLMAAGLVLACGVLVQLWRARGQWLGWLGIAGALCAMAWLAHALLKSYSRGSWLAAIAGLAFLACCLTNKQQTRGSNQSHRPDWGGQSAWPIAIILASLAILVILNFRGSDQALLRRFASVANPNDFSWRNRVASWEGSLQIIADKPLLGHGWELPEKLHEQLYRPARMETGAAINLNDYLVTGASIGVLGLAALLIVIAQPIRKSLKNRHPPGEQPIQTAFTAVVIIFAVAFWFDGGLFKLSTATLFWIAASMNPGVIAEQGKPATELQVDA
jgi:O-antigen ligase